ncbi:MAG: 3-deoxy-7-phosphoheptulonate synthase [Desulfobacterales bacterium]|nr:MAG: 3-deoxy-7-phosphoheptulonate synthase [Desulfobacterales bacterium]
MVRLSSKKAHLNKAAEAFFTLPTPNEMRRQIPVSQTSMAVTLRARRAIGEILFGRDRRLLVVAGPCSLHHEASALEYARRFARLAEEVSDRMLLVMRAYLEKPRTTVGWKGLINDPDMDGSCDLARGLPLGRRLLLQITELGVPAATELLEPGTPAYLMDAVSWAAIGARTTESQIHREMASGLPFAVGFKNGTDGGLSSAVNAVAAAGGAHAFPGINPDGRVSVHRTGGNPFCHLVLRGGRRPNYDPVSVEAAGAALRAAGLLPRLMVDCSHGNSRKDHRRQGPIFTELVRRIAAGERAICGLMLESHLLEGRITHRAGAPPPFGISVTDACMGWEETESVIRAGAEALASA